MSLARFIDHTNLKPEADSRDIDRLVAEGLEHGFASVCVNGCHTGSVARALNGSNVLTCATAAFPLGAMHSAVKAAEAARACADGADEIDFVAGLRHLIAIDAGATEAEFIEVSRQARSINPDVVVKVILETAALMAGVDEGTAERRIQTGCAAAFRAGCDFVKTSTGFHPAGGATEQAVRLLRKHAGTLKVKASGGIRTRDDALRMLDAGADRLGCSASAAIVQGA